MIGEILSCEREEDNLHDLFAVRVTKPGETQTIGHLPRLISSTASLFIQRGGTIQCTVTGGRRYSVDLIQGGLEVPCKLQFDSPTTALLSRVKKLLFYCEVTTTQSTVIGHEPTNDVQLPKKIKLEDNVSMATTSATTDTKWILFEHFMLMELHKSTIENGDWLEDAHINFAQKLLKHQFPNSIGLLSTNYQNKFKLTMTSNLVQILHCRGNHWVVISSDNNIDDSRTTVNLYDTLFDTVDNGTKETINNIFSKAMQVNVVTIQKQKGVKDCGAFAIAIATALLHKTPLKTFNQHLLRPHLISCFENYKLTPFY